MSKKELATAPSAEAIAWLKESFPVESGQAKMLLPRIGMYSQDQTEGKGKAMKVIAEAGTFYIENKTDEVDENGKNIWAKTEIGTTIDVTILFRRKQLRHYDSANETYTSSPVYDTDDEVIPLFKNKAEVARGTEKELRSLREYWGLSAKGKPISKLEENRILYVLYKDELYQLSLRGTSMYAFMTYAKTVTVPTVLTTIDSEAKENGSISWSQMTFKVAKQLDADEVANVTEKIKEIKEVIASEKSAFTQATKVDNDFDKLGTATN